MKNFAEAFIRSINEKDPSIMPMADRYAATENGIPAALCHMECYRLIDKVNFVGVLAEDEVKNTAYVMLNVSEGNTDVILSARMTGADDKISEAEINIYRSRSDTGFWYAVDDMKKWEPVWNSVVPEEQRASREELEVFADAVFDNSKDASMFPAAKGSHMMEAGGEVYESVEYAKKLAPNPEDLVVEEGVERIVMQYMIDPNRPNSNNVRVQAIDVEKGLIIISAYMNGVVSPYIVPDETSTCFVPEEMLWLHHSTLTDELFEGQKAMVEMRAAGENTSVIKIANGQLQHLMQNIKIKPYNAIDSWSEDIFVK
jgi:hypothetical protein